MAKHLLRDLERLKKEILGVGALVEQAIHRATTALSERRPDLADEVIRGDDEIDQREVEVEEECLKALALHQPVAADLRFIVAVLKVNNDLERMGDLAVNIAERAQFLAQYPPLSIPSFGELVHKVRQMVRESLDALVNLDVDLARKVQAEDDDVDRLHRSMYEKLQDLMHRDPGTIDRAISLISASRQLERLADHATNIAEDVEFLVAGEITRHRGE